MNREALASRTIVSYLWNSRVRLRHGLGLAEGTGAEAWTALCALWLSELS